jgi:hypothetical protein
MNKLQDIVVGFSAVNVSFDGCARTTLYTVNSDQSIFVSHQGKWSPMEPQMPLERAMLVTRYNSGRTLAIDLEGSEQQALIDHDRFPTLLRKIAQGQMPGQALNRQLSKALGRP